MTTEVVSVPYNFTPRSYQIPFFEAMADDCKRAVLIWHRRAGKDVTAWNFLIYRALKQKGVYYYIFPTFAQGRKAVWDSITTDGERFLDYVPPCYLLGKPNSTEMKIRLVNGSIIQIVGSDKYDNLMGTNPIGCIFSEYSLQNSKAWEFIRPILDINGGWAVFVYTPRGSNHGKELYDMARRNSSWFCQKLTVDDTHVLSKDDIKRLQEEEKMSIDMIMQEYYCSFDMGIQGSYYAKYIQEAYDVNRICKVPYQKSSLVHTSWDIGYSDHTSIIFFQTIGNSIHILDFFEAHHEPMSYYAEYIKSLKYNYGRHFAPHDIESTDFARGISPKDVAASLDIDFTVIPLTKITEGIECVRGNFSRMWFDEFKCRELLVHIENYRSEYNDRLGIYSSKPLHDKHSHAADSLRYLCLGVTKYLDNKTKIINDLDYEKMRDAYLPKFG